MLSITTDYFPLKNKTYFHNFNNEKDGITIIIPFYNEESHELEATLNSLFYCIKYLTHFKPEWEEEKIQILLIQDGWYKSSDSMKKYLKQLYDIEIDGKHWSDYYQDFNDETYTKEPTAFIFEDNKPICFNRHKTPNKEIAKYLNISLLIKIDNRKKHNSHEWFIGRNGFSEVKQSKYMFCTDCFTMYHKACLYHLVNHMDNNEKTAVCTGRQRVMSRDMQGSNENILSLSSILRDVQLFDFESSNAVYNGAFSIVGFLPVIPGPCGLYRSSILLKDEVRYWYFDLVNKEPTETGLVLGNLRIAEDRILSYSVLLKNEEPANMMFVPESVFYFEAETSLKQFILQRRRWINGTVAGYIYLLMIEPEHFIKWNINIFRKMYILFLLSLQILTYFIVGFSPAISLTIFYHSLLYILNYSSLNYVTVEMVSVLFLIFGWILYIVHYYVHNNKKFDSNVIYMLLFFSMIISIATLLSLILFVIQNYSMMSLITYILFSGNITIKIIILVFILPFLNGILISNSCHSFFYMIKSFLSYFLFSHMLISTFGSYSYSRFFDLTWGNRPTSENITSNITEEEMEHTKELFLIKCRRMIILLIIMNILVFFIPENIQLGILGIFFYIAAYQLSLSTLFLIKNIPSKIKYLYRICRKDDDIKNIVMKEYRDALVLAPELSDTEEVEEIVIV
jgi:chitin synthase